MDKLPDGFEVVGARNAEQVQRVLQGKAYQRIQPPSQGQIR